MTLDASQLKAVEHAALDAKAHVWRRARLAMVEGVELVGYPCFSRADMAELARLYDPAALALPVAPGGSGDE